MYYTHVYLVVLFILIGEMCYGQDSLSVRRRKLRTRTKVDKSTEQESEVVGTRKQGAVRSRQRALQRVKSDSEPEKSLSEAPMSQLRGFGGRRRRPGARGLGARGQGRPRGSSSRRFPGGRRRPRPPVYYYEDYYYDPAYDSDYYGYDYDYDLGPLQSQSPSTDTAQSPELPDIGGEDYGGLIKELWRQFLAEKQSVSTTVDTEHTEEYECPPRDDVSYYLPDKLQCDRYLECNIKGQLRPHLCPDGFVFDISLEKCDYPVKVNCSTRPQLQEPQPSVNCSRANGFFPWPSNISCQNFWDCREGTAYKQTCPVGVIFDPGLNACATPDQSSRKECTEGRNSFLGFQCPTYTQNSVLRFGNHDRLPDPDDCQKYFTCLRTGGPRLANCGRKKVFNNVTGQCGDPKDVPGCETYWIDKLKEEGEDEEYYYDY